MRHDGRKRDTGHAFILALALADNVVMADRDHEGNEPSTGCPGSLAGHGPRRATAGAVELLADADRPGSWVLLVDGTPQSHVDLDDPLHLEFEYMRRLGHVADLAAPAGQPLRVLHLGGGGLTLARYVAATRPGSGQLAVESDATIVDLVRRRLPLASSRATRAGRIRVRQADARAVLESVRPGSWDLVVADVFDGPQTPAHLTSAEFAAAARRALAPSGIFAANIGDGPPLRHTRSRVAAVQAAFGICCLIAESAVIRGRRYGNLIVLGSGTALPVAALTRRAAADPFPALVLDEAGLGRFVAGARPITDAAQVPASVPPPDVFADRRAGARRTRVPPA
jgi:spermidine synthase